MSTIDIRSDTVTRIIVSKYIEVFSNNGSLYIGDSIDEIEICFLVSDVENLKKALDKAVELWDTSPTN